MLGGLSTVVRRLQGFIWALGMLSGGVRNATDSECWGMWRTEKELTKWRSDLQGPMRASHSRNSSIENPSIRFPRVARNLAQPDSSVKATMIIYSIEFYPQCEALWIKAR